MGGPITKNAMQIRVIALVILTLLVLPPAFTPAADADGGSRTSLPDLTIVALYNYTQVVTGEPCWFNLTIHNAGDGAYLVSTSEDLEIYGYRDEETQVAFFQRWRHNIYVNMTQVLDIQIQYDSVGEHSLTIVIDEANRVDESDETNNQASTQFDVIASQENRRPKADGGNDRDGQKDKAMLFSAACSSDPDGDALTYLWDFGDGNVGAGIRTYHAYEELGDYHVVLTVSDGAMSDTDKFTVHIVEAPSNQPPVAVISVPVDQVEVGKGLTIDGSQSHDPDGDSKRLEYDWDFDDSDGVDDWVRGPAVVISWEKAGTYTVTLRVSDGIATSTATRKITVTVPTPPNAPPTANAGVNVVLAKGDEWTFRGTGSDVDGSIVAYEWDLDNDGAYDTYSSSSGVLKHTFDRTGYVTLWFRVIDDDGDAGVDSVVITVKEVKTSGKEVPGLPPFVIILIICLAAIVLRKGHGEEHWQRYKS